MFIRYAEQEPFKKGSESHKPENVEQQRDIFCLWGLGPLCAWPVATFNMSVIPILRCRISKLPGNKL